MARPREFDEGKVLDQALGVFWRRGYEGASIADLVAATGLQRQSLYGAFTDKQGLFQAALGRYVVHVTTSLGPLGRPGAGLGDLRCYMEGVLVAQRGEGLGACWLVKTAFGPEAADGEIRGTVEAGARLVRGCFARVLAGAIARGEAPRSLDPGAGAAFLYTVLNGLSALIRTGGEEAHVAAALTLAFASLGGAAAPAAAPGARRPRGSGRAAPRR